MTPSAKPAAWSQRVTENSPMVKRSQERSVQQARVLLDAALRLIAQNGETFTTHELVKEAGVALQTFYRYFPGKDELLLAVLEDMITTAAALFEARVAGVDDPVERLESYVRSVVAELDAGAGSATSRFVASQHWRLSALFPDELALATKPMTDLVRVEVVAATERGLLRSADPSRDAWLVTQLLVSVFHHHSFSPSKDETLADDLWRFCLQALGGTDTTP